MVRNLQQTRASEANKTHGHTIGGSTRTYVSWAMMKNRCSNPNYRRFDRYGGRGVSYCESWAQFETFLADMGERPPGLSLDRIDNDKGYSKENCRWATQSEQGTNSCSVRWIELDGQRKTLSQWAKEAGLSVGTLHKRLKRGWTIGEAVQDRGRRRA